MLNGLFIPTILQLNRFYLDLVHSPYAYTKYLAHLVTSCIAVVHNVTLSFILCGCSDSVLISGTPTVKTIFQLSFQICWCVWTRLRVPFWFLGWFGPVLTSPSASLLRFSSPSLRFAFNLNYISSSPWNPANVPFFVIELYCELIWILNLISACGGG